MISIELGRSAPRECEGVSKSRRWRGTAREPSASTQISFTPKEKNHGKKIFEEGIKLSQARDEEAQVRHFEERPIGSESEKPQAGNCDRIVRSQSRRPESPEKAIERARQEVPAEIPVSKAAGGGLRKPAARLFSSGTCGHYNPIPTPDPRRLCEIDCVAARAHHLPQEAGLRKDG